MKHGSGGFKSPVGHKPSKSARKVNVFRLKGGMKKYMGKAVRPASSNRHTP